MISPSLQNLVAFLLIQRDLGQPGSLEPLAISLKVSTRVQALVDHAEELNAFGQLAVCNEIRRHQFYGALRGSRRSDACGQASLEGVGIVVGRLGFSFQEELNGPVRLSEENQAVGTTSRLLSVSSLRFVQTNSTQLSRLEDGTADKMEMC